MDGNAEGKDRLMLILERACKDDSIGREFEKMWNLILHWLNCGASIVYYDILTVNKYLKTIMKQ